MPKRVSLSPLILVLALANLDSPPSGFAQERASADKIDQQDVIRRDVDVVSVYFAVRDDKKRLVSDLPQDKFTVSEDGRSQAIKFFAHHSDVVLNVGVLLDTGTNMSWILSEEAQASRLFVQHVVRPTDLGFILSYAERVETVQLPTADVALLEEKAGTIQLGGGAIGLPESSPSPSRGVWWPGGVPVGVTGKRINMMRQAHLYDAIRAGTLRYLKGEVGRKAKLSPRTFCIFSRELSFSPVRIVSQRRPAVCSGRC